MFSIHTAPKLETQQSPVNLGLCLTKTRSGKSYVFRDAIIFEKLRFRNVTVHKKRKAGGIRSLFEKLFQISRAWCGQDLA